MKKFHKNAKKFDFANYRARYHGEPWFAYRMRQQGRDENYVPDDIEHMDTFEDYYRSKGVTSRDPGPWSLSGTKPRDPASRRGRPPA